MITKQKTLPNTFIEEMETALRTGKAREVRYDARDHSGWYVRMVEWKGETYLHEHKPLDKTHKVATIPANRINETGVFPYGFEGIIKPELVVYA